MWAQIPLFCRLILLVTLFTQILSFVLPSLPAVLACIPNLVVYSFQRKFNQKLMTRFLVWRLFTSYLIHANILDMLFSLLSYIFTAIAIEQELGTVRTTYRFIALGLLTMVTFTIICGLTGFN
jgi:membrane associated rhomboid family serine protease